MISSTVLEMVDPDLVITNLRVGQPSHQLLADHGVTNVSSLSKRDFSYEAACHVSVTSREARGRRAEFFFML